MIRETYTFGDVLMVPKYSTVRSRREVSTEARLSRHLTLSVPLVSANMDTVTEYRMARFMAEVGGIGIIHRFLTIEQQVEEVTKVKRVESAKIDDPYTISPEATAEGAAQMMATHGVSGLIVVDGKRKVIGILTRHDLHFLENRKISVAKIMTKKVITAAPQTTVAQAKKILFQHRVEKLPLVDKKGILKGLMTLKDILRQNSADGVSKDKRGRLLVGAAVGVKEETEERARKLLDAGADVIVVDIAHGHNIRALDTIKMLKKKFPGVELIGGNVATATAALDLIKIGVDGIKIGVGPGAACTTRIVTGVGIPQLSAIMDVTLAAKNVPCIADGGVQTSGDLSKALAAGASTAMMGSLFAGTDEAPGQMILEDGVGYKLYRGMASQDATDAKVKVDGGSDGFYRSPEGKSGKVVYRGKAQNIVTDLLSGLRSSMSYLGARTISEFQKNAEFVKITEAGKKESHSHDMRV